jgi:cob(I)alamin adenosyltransferase
MRRIIVLTGDGKGKTTSAIGSAVRAVGRGFKVYFYQFLKSKDAEYGEHLFFKKSKDLNLVKLGLGCRKDFKYTAKDKKAATDGLKKIDAELSKNKKAKTLCVLDEVSYPMNWNWFAVEEVTKLIKKHSKVNFILTGRDMPKKLISLADTASSVEEIKHAYQNGCKAGNGIEF